MNIVDPKEALRVLDMRRNLAIFFILSTIILNAEVLIYLVNPYILFNKWYFRSWLSIWFISGIFFSMWFYRAYCNLKLLGMGKLRWDPYFAALSIWVPIANLYLPYAIMSELHSSSTINDNEKRKPSRLPLVWWVCLLSSFFLGLAIHSTGSQSDIGIFLNLIRYFLFAFSGVILIKLISNINQEQHRSFEFIRSTH